MARKYKYIGREYTKVQLKKDGQKVRVDSGETIESDLPYTYMVGNRFIAVEDDGTATPKLKIKDSKESKEAASDPVNPKSKKKEVAEDGSSEAEEMTIEEAKAYLKKNGVKFHPKTGLKKLLAAVEAHKSE